MKKFFLIFVVFSLFVFAGCGGSSKKTDNTDSGETVTDEDGETADEEPADDTEPAGDTTPDNGDSDTDSSDSTDEADSSDSEDSQSDGDTDSGDSADSQQDDDTDNDDPDTDTDTDTDTTPADPCKPNPCSGIADTDAAHTCTAKGETAFECGCAEGYSWDNGSCVMTADENINPVPADQKNEEGFSCDPNTFVEFCDGNTVVYCNMGKVYLYNCDDSGTGGTAQTCMTTINLYGGNYIGRNYADCYDTCETPGKNPASCHQELGYAGGIVTSDLCLKTSKGYLNFDEMIEENCDTPCDDDNKACIPLNEVPASQNNTNDATCDPETFVEFCDGQKAVSCEKGKVVREYCPSSGTKCLTTIGVFDKLESEKSKNHAYCHKSCSETDEVIKRNKCYDTNYEIFSLGTLVQDMCLYTSKGRMLFNDIPVEQCDTPCASDGKSCIELNEIPSTQNNTKDAPCDPDTFVEFCDENRAVSCYNNKVSYTNCNVCLATLLDWKGGLTGRNDVKCLDSCMQSSQQCKKLDTTYYMVYNMCAETSKGLVNLHFEPHCSAGCAADNKTCELPECSKSSGAPCYDSASGLIWSAKSSTDMSWDKAVSYCERMGSSGWHLPTISELRTLIQHCSSTVTGGSCGVTDTCLSSDCRNDACGCSSNTSSNKLGDTDWVWSSSVESDYSYNAWGVNFYFGSVNSDSKRYDYEHYVRCVR